MPLGTVDRRTWSQLAATLRDTAGTKLHEETERRRATRTAVGPKNHRVLGRIGTRLEEVEPQTLATVCGVDVARPGSDGRITEGVWVDIVLIKLRSRRRAVKLLDADRDGRELAMRSRR